MVDIPWTELGATGIRVSKICVGTWQASGWKSSGDAQFITTLRHALDKGINFIDTAIRYGNGHSEQLVGAALKGHREKFVIATKFWHTDSTPQGIRASLEQSLENLGTDYIDLFQQHWPPKDIPLDDTLAELVRLRGEGKIRAIGVSNWLEPEWNEVSDPTIVQCLQPNYSLLYRNVEKNVLPFCLKNNIAVIPYSPLCQGILAGRYSSLEDVPDDHRKKVRFFAPSVFPEVLSLVETLTSIGEAYGKSPAQTALRWLLQQPGVTAPIVGASSPSQVDENVGMFGWELSPHHMQMLEERSAPLALDIEPHDSLWHFHPRKGKR